MTKFIVDRRVEIWPFKRRSYVVWKLEEILDDECGVQTVKHGGGAVLI